MNKFIINEYFIKYKHQSQIWKPWVQRMGEITRIGWWYKTGPIQRKSFHDRHSLHEMPVKYQDESR